MHSQAYDQSLALLRSAATPHGFVASVQDISNYQRIWTRDGVITSLAALLSGEEQLLQACEATLHTIFRAQHRVGFFPSNVDPRTGQASYGGNCGRVDNVSWAIIGLLQYAYSTADSRLAKTYQAQVEKGFALLDAWEFNGKHLVYVPQSGNWADEYVQHGYVLYDQLLRVWALELAGKYYQRPEWLSQAKVIRQVIQHNYWNEPAADGTDLYAPNLRHQLQHTPSTYWLTGFNPARVYAQFDLAANALALLLGIGTPAQNSVLTEHIQQRLTDQPGLLPAFDPAIEAPDPLMSELIDNYAYTFRNQPHEFHNGGLWPVWNGWLAAAFYQQNAPQLAAEVIHHLAAANRQNPIDPRCWGFYENFHGRTQAPIGVPYCTWSAAGALLAEGYARGRRLVS